MPSLPCLRAPEAVETSTQRIERHVTFGKLEGDRVAERRAEHAPFANLRARLDCDAAEATAHAHVAITMIDDHDLPLPFELTNEGHGAGSDRAYGLAGQGRELDGSTRELDRGYTGARLANAHATDGDRHHAGDGPRQLPSSALKPDGLLVTRKLMCFT